MLKKKNVSLHCIFTQLVAPPLIIFVVLDCTVEDNCTTEVKCTIAHPFLPFPSYTNVFIHKSPTSRLIVSAPIHVQTDRHEIGQGFKGVCSAEKTGRQLPCAVRGASHLHTQRTQLSDSSYRRRCQTFSELKAACGYKPNEDLEDSDDTLIPHAKISLNLTNTFCTAL